MRVLLAEDHADTREMFVTYLWTHAITVDVAVTGLQAVDLAVASPPDIIVLDLQMPGMDGWTAARHLRANAVTRDIPIIAMSAHAFPDDEARAYDSGCDAFLSKPCPPPVLLAALHRCRSRRFA